MAHFRVDSTFILKGRYYLCAIGDVLDGEVQAGMIARLEVAGVITIARPIHAIELASGISGTRPTLVFRYETAAAALEARDSLPAGSVLSCERAI